MNPILAALDVSSREQALRLAGVLRGHVGGFKIGSELFTAEGPAIVRELAALGDRIFLDLKFHDIPNTVANSVEAAAAAGVDMLTIHASGGSAMLSAARAAVGDDGPRLLAVTLLTSLSASAVEEVWAKELRSLREEVARLAALAANCGIHGVVASVHEAESLKRKHGPDFLVVTPGIRPGGQNLQDHARAATPADAVRAGADFIVVGRPIIKANDPVAVADAILGELESQPDAES